MRRRQPGADAHLVASLDADTRRHRLFEGIDRCLGHLARDRTVVLLLDDLHFADRAVLRLLQRVVRSGATRHIAVAAAFRPNEADARGQLRATLASLRQQLPVVDVPVSALTEADVAQLLASWMGGGNGNGARASTGLAQRVERIADDVGDVELFLRAAKCRLQTLVTLDPWPNVLELAETLRRRAQLVRHPEQERLALSFDAVLAGNAGRFAEAERLAAEAYDLLVNRRGQRAHAEIVYVLQHLSWRWLESRVAELLEPASRLADLRRTQPFWGAIVDTRRPVWHARMSWVLAECGQTQLAAEHLRAADLARYLRGDRGAEFWHTVTTAALAATLLDDQTHARPLYEHLLPYRDRNAFVGQVAFLGCVEHRLGLLGFRRPRGTPASCVRARRGRGPWLVSPCSRSSRSAHVVRAW